MEWLKQTSLSDLKALYSGFHGFVFHSSIRSSEQTLEALAENIRKAGITNDYPLLATYFDGGFIFVYKEMDAPSFWAKADFFNQTGMGNVEPLLFFLNRIKDSEEEPQSSI
jgi:hypothetical protein